MTDHLERHIKSYLETSADTAVALEARSGIPKGSLSHVLRGHTPRVDRLAQLLTGLDDTTAAAWLRAYLIDHTPQTWQPRTSITIDGHAPPALTRDRLANAIDWLATKCAGDDDLAEWLIATVAILRGPDAEPPNCDTTSTLALLAEPETPYDATDR